MLFSPTTDLSPSPLENTATTAFFLLSTFERDLERLGTRSTAIANRTQAVQYNKPFLSDILDAVNSSSNYAINSLPQYGEPTEDLIIVDIACRSSQLQGVIVECTGRSANDHINRPPVNAHFDVGSGGIVESYVRGQKRSVVTTFSKTGSLL